MAGTNEDSIVAPLDPSELDSLHQFHLSHFPSQKVPSSHDNTISAPSELILATDDLGVYADGVRRTLTDEQVRMFRHSEIQRLLLGRRQQREKDEEDLKRRNRTTDRRINQKRHFDEPEKDNPVVDTLTYDDEPAASKSKDPVEKKFLWPELRK